MWVKSEYAGALAVFSTWVCGLLPWSVTFFQRELESGVSVTAIWIRFLPGRFLYVFGLGFPGDSPYRWAWEVPGFVATRGETLASYVWLAGAAVFAVAFLVSLLYYADEKRVEAWRVDPVCLLGWLLGLTGAVLLGAVALLWRFQGGVAIPVGVLFQLGLGAVLLRVDRT
jgi:uncharacterized protein (TIGR04206 family)